MKQHAHQLWYFAAVAIAAFALLGSLIGALTADEIVKHLLMAILFALLSIHDQIED